MNSLIEKLNILIDNKGSENIVNNKKVKELINEKYNFSLIQYETLSDIEEIYLLNKIIDYANGIKKVVSLLKADLNSRQAVITFSQSQPLPNCTVSIHFQIRNETLFCNVFQRSQDIKKVNLDVSIFQAISKYIIDKFPQVQYFKGTVFVMNIHKYIM